MKNTKISTNAVLFTVFEIVNKAIPFLMLPILTRFLTPNDYGLISIFIVFTSFFTIFIGLSGHGAINANYFKISKERLAAYISNVILILSFSLIIILAITLLFGERIFLAFDLPIEWQFAAVFTSFCQYLTLINLTLWVAEQKPANHGIYQISQTSIYALISITAVVFLDLEWVGHLSGLVISSGLFGIVSIYFLYLRGYLHLKFRRLYLKDFLLFSLPLVPHQFGDWLRIQADKLLLISILGVAATGGFSVAQQIAFIMLIIITSLNKSLYPVLFKILSAKPDEAKKRSVVKASYLLGIGVTIVCMLGVALTPLIYPYLLGDDFQNSIIITQLILVAMIFEAYYYIVVNYIFFHKRTKVLALITFSMSMVHISLSFIFVAIFNFGAEAIAVSMIISSFLQFLLVWVYSNRVYPMPWLLSRK